MRLQIEVNSANSNIKNFQENIKFISEQIETQKREKNEEIELLKKQHQQIINELKEQMTDTFKVLAADVLKQQSNEFRSLADEDLTRRQQSIEGIVQPVQENLTKLEREIRELEKERTGSYSELKTQVNSLLQVEKELRQETGNLVRALRQPTGRGQWGEVVLEKVLEMSGMVENTHYKKQESSSNDERGIRPDIVVNLPGDRNIVIDSKAVMNAYLNAALDTLDEAEIEKQHKNHVNHLRTRIKDLSSKEYSSQFQPSPEFVILFLPAESLFSCALQYDKELLSFAASKNIILSTPSTLIALLRTIYYGWQQDEIAKNAKEIGRIGSELYDRFIKMVSYFNEVGKSIKKSGEAFDQTVSSFNSRLLPSVRTLGKMVGKESNETNEIKELSIIPKNFPDLT